MNPACDWEWGYMVEQWTHDSRWQPSFSEYFVFNFVQTDSLEIADIIMTGYESEILETFTH